LSAIKLRRMSESGRKLPLERRMRVSAIGKYGADIGKKMEEGDPTALCDEAE
jgi:hypothetical protein